jgi:drug/metabolite transporter (DMT)-like permease
MIVSSARLPQGRFTPRLWLFFACVTMIWGSTWLVIKYQLGTVPPSWSVTWRFLVAGLVMLAYCLAARRSLKLTRAGHGFAVLLGLMQFSLNFNLVYRAEEHVTSGLVALTFALLVLPNALLSRLFLGTSVSPRFLLGSIMGIVGVVAMCWTDLARPGLAGGEVLFGLGLAVAGVLAASVANVMQATRQGRAQPLEGGLAWSMFYGTLMNAALAWSVSGPPLIDASLGYLAGVTYLACAASALAFVLYYQLIREVGAGKAAYSGVLVPLVALALSTLFEGFQWTALAAAGAALALAGLVVALRSR